MQLYIFMLPCALLAIALYVIGAWRFGMTAGPGFVAVSGVAGFFTGFASNMRSSHLPLYAGLFALFAAAMVAGTMRREAGPAETRRRRALTLTVWTAASAAAFVATYAVFGAVFIKPLPKVSYNYSYHSIAHPLVLALAVPENPLSRREGIAWDDSVGVPLARRIDPNVTYVGPGYDDALFEYYGGLWRRHPQEMRRIYRLKAEMAGTGVVRPTTLKNAGFYAFVLYPLNWISNGILLFVVLCAVFLVSAVAVWRDQSVIALLIGLVAATGAALVVEAAVIMPYFYLQYQSLLLFALIVVSASVYWRGVLALPSIAAWSWRWARSHRADAAVVALLAARGAFGPSAGAAVLSLATYALLRPWCSTWTSAIGSAGVLFSLSAAFWPFDAWMACGALLSAVATASHAARVEAGWRRGMWLALAGASLATVGARVGLNPWVLAVYLSVSMAFLGPASLRTRVRRAPAIALVIVGATLILSYLVNTGPTVRTRWWEDAIAGSSPAFDASLGISGTGFRFAPSMSGWLEELRVRAYGEGLGLTALHNHHDGNAFDTAGERLVARAWSTFPADTVLRAGASTVRHLAGLTRAEPAVWGTTEHFGGDAAFARRLLNTAHAALWPAAIIGVAAAAAHGLRTCLWVVLTILLLAGNQGGPWRPWDMAGAVVVLWALIAVSAEVAARAIVRMAGVARPERWQLVAQPAARTIGVLMAVSAIGIAGVWSLRLFQQTAVSSVVREWLAAPTAEAFSARAGEPDIVAPRQEGHLRVVDPMVKAAAASFVRLHVVPCGQEVAHVSLRYDVGTPGAELATAVDVRPPVAPRRETQLLFPVYMAFSPQGELTKGTRTAFVGVDLPAQDESCVTTLEYTRLPASTAPVLIVAEAVADWDARRHYQMLTPWFSPASRSSASVALVSAIPNASMVTAPGHPGTPLTPKDMASMDPVMQVGESGWLADGSALSAHAYLLVASPRTLGKGGTVFVSGRLNEGALTLGLIGSPSGHWAATLPIQTIGAFAASVQAPESGEYFIVIANAHPEGGSRASVAITDIRWQP